MQTLTFTQKLLRQRRFLSFLLPLFAIFGFSAIQTAQAQIIDNTVTLNVRGTSGTYNTQAGASGTGNFFEQNFGTFDSSVPSNVFRLTGATLSIQETPGGAEYDQAEIGFRVFAGDFTTSATITNPAFTYLDLGTGVLGAGNVRTFTLSAANQNLLATAVGSVSPGTSNRFDVRFRAFDNLVTGGSVVSPIRRSVFTLITPPANGVTLSNPTVIVNQGNTDVTRTGTAFNGTVLIDQKPGSTTTPAFEINNGQLIIKGGSITTTETGASVVNGAFLDYTLYNPNFTSVITTGTLQLTQQPGSTGGVRTFALSSGTTNLIPLVPNAANGYVLSVSYHATYQNGGTGAPVRVDDAGPGPGYNASFDVTGTRTPAPTLNPNTIQIAPDGGSATSYFFPNNPGATPQFPGATFTSSTNAGGVPGAFDVNNGQLRLTNTTVSTTESGTNTVSTVVLYYRTRLAGSSGGAFQPITLSQSGPAAGGTRLFVIDPASTTNTNAQPNLIATPAVTAPGNYTVDIYYQANGTNNATGTPFSITYPPTGVLSANFTVAGTPIATTIWTGAVNDNWFDPANWSNGVPNAGTNALIRDLGAGNSVPYPNINSDTRVTTAGGALLYDNTGSGPAKALNLTMGGSSQASRSITRLVSGQLQVFGNFENTYDSFIQRENTIMEFAGGNQTISNGSFVRVDISGGGTKTLTGIMSISENLNFLTPALQQFNTVLPNPYTPVATNAGILVTNIQTPGVNVVILSDRALINGNNGAQINGETDASYLRGFVRTTRISVLVGETRTYGNMGLTLTFTGTNAPGNVDVTRNTSEAYSPLNNRYGIRRIFGVRPSDPQTNTGGLQATMVFRYRDSETQNLNGPQTYTPGSATTPESELTIFLSSNGGNTFQLIGRDAINTTTNEVTRAGVTQFATFTLADKNNPLPVTLTSFEAKRVSTDAQLTWATATEKNSRGFDVQVSTDGKEFRTIGFVASVSANSVSPNSYSYVDAEKNKAGTRYYRLRQVDLDGTSYFFGPRTVNFDGKAVETAVTAYPNPFGSADQLHLTLESNLSGIGQVRVMDMTGRMVSQQRIDIMPGSNDVAVNRLNDLKAGLYMVNITMPNGEVKNLKVMKQ